MGSILAALATETLGFQEQQCQRLSSSIGWKVPPSLCRQMVAGVERPLAAQPSSLGSWEFFLEML